MINKNKNKINKKLDKQLVNIKKIWIKNNKFYHQSWHLKILLRKIVKFIQVIIVVSIKKNM